MKNQINELQKQSTEDTKFVLFTNEFGFDMFVSNPEKYDGVVTDIENEAMLFSVGFDNPEIKLKAWSLTTGYNFTIKYL